MIVEILKLLGLVALPFTLYLSWKKIGYDIRAQIVWSVGPLVAPGISSVTLCNMKDRSIVVFDMHAAQDGKSFLLAEFSPPLILKALEATTIAIQPVSARYLGAEKIDWSWPLDSRNDLSILLSTNGRTLMCGNLNAESRLGYAHKKGLRLVVNTTRRFNGEIYDDRARYALTYTEKNGQKTAFIDVAGIIYWGLSPNGLAASDLSSAESVAEALDRSHLSVVIAPFVVESLPPRDPPDAAFRPGRKI